MAVYYNQGTHTAEIVGQEFVETEYGTQFVVRIMPEGGEYERSVFLGLTDEHGKPAKFENSAGETINVADQSLEVIAYLGLPDQRLSRLDPGHPEHVSFIGQRVTCYCQHKVKDGKTGERWYINTPRALPGKPVEKGALKKLDSLFGRALKDKVKQQPAAPSEAKQDPQTADDPMSPEEVNKTLAETDGSERYF
jgi:hypothetical protein